MLKGGAARKPGVAGEARLRTDHRGAGDPGRGLFCQRLRASGGTESELEPSKPDLKVSPEVWRTG